MRLGVDPRHADQVVRGTVVLPHGTGKPVRVLVITQGERVREAEAAGADFVGIEYIQKLKDGWLECDVIVATPDVMGQLGQLGRVLGPRGLMPNPKAGTVTMDVAKAVREIKAGKIEFRVDKTGNVHAPVGKVSFSPAQLADNVRRLHGHHRPGQAVRGQGHLHPLGDHLEHHGAGRAARYGGVPMNKTERQETVESLSALLKDTPQRLRDRLQRHERAAHDRVPPPAPRRGGLVRGGEEHAGPAGAGRQRHHRAGRAPGRPDRAWCSRRIPSPRPRSSATSPRSSSGRR